MIASLPFNKRSNASVIAAARATCWDMVSLPCHAGAGSEYRPTAVACRPFWWRSIVATVTMVISFASSFGYATATTPIPLMPYKVVVVTAISSSPELTAAVDRDLRAELPARAQSLVGAAWQVSVGTLPAGQRWAAATNLESIPAEAVLGSAADADKAILLAISPVEQGYRVVARQLDVRTQTWNAPVARLVRQTSRLREAAMRALLAAFGATGTIEVVNQQQVEVRLRASALAPIDPAVALVRPGDVLRPVFRLTDGAGKAEQIVRPAWTWLRVERVSPERIDCRLECGLQGAKLPPAGGRLESLAIGVSHVDRPTRLVMRSRTPPHSPLAAYEVFRKTDEAAGAVLLGRSDREGAVTIPAGLALLEVLLVRAGGQPLARLPMVPGAEAELSVSLPDATLLIETQGRLAGAQVQIVDEVARRQSLMAVVQSRLEGKQLGDAEAALRELKALSGRDAIAKTIADDKKWAVTDDVALQRRIDALFAQTTKLLDEQLSPEPIASVEAAFKAAAGK